MDKIKKLREILYATSQAYKDFMTSFSYGKTTDELFFAFRNSLRESLGKYEIVYDYIWGKDSANIDGITVGSYVPQEGDTLIMDISVGKDGIWCDVCRTFFVGEPTKEQRETFEWIKEILRAGQQTLKTGVQASEIYKIINAMYEMRGKTLVHHAGHRIGEKPLLQPQFLMGNDAPIVMGEIYTLEPGFYENFGIRLENDFLITEDGAVDLFEELMPLKIEEFILQ